MSAYEDKIRRFFESLGSNSMHLVAEFYAPHAHFQDPVVDLHGVEAIQRYYSGLYQAVQEIQFTFSDIIVTDNRYAATWTMRLVAPKLNGGKSIEVPGTSVIVFDPALGKAIFHRDYFDMGKFIYENIPILSHIIGFIKKRLH